MRLDVWQKPVRKKEMPLPQGENEIITVVNRYGKNGKDASHFFPGVGITARKAGKVVPPGCLSRLPVLLRAVSSIKNLDMSKQSLFKETGIKGAGPSFRMGANGNPPGIVDILQQFTGIKARGYILKGTKDEKITPGSVIFHAKNHHQAIILDTLPEALPNIHAVMIRDTDTIQPSRRGLRDNL